MPTTPSAHAAGSADSPPVGANSSARRGWLVLGIFLAAYLALGVGSYSQKSATFDEPLHLAAGFLALNNHDHRVDPTHPPLLRMWAALPLLAMEDVSASGRPMDSVGPRQWPQQWFNFAHQFLYVGHDADRLLDAARFMILLLGALLAVLLFFWAWEWLGWWPAVGVLGFFLIEPNLSAHTGLVTTDAGMTLFYFATVYFLWRTVKSYTPLNVGGLALSFALAVVSKFSAVLLAPVIAVLLVAAMADGRTTITLRRGLVIIGLLAVVTYGMIWTVYGFRYLPSDTPNWVYRSQDLVAVNAYTPLLNRVLNWVDAWQLLPNAFTQGFILSFATSNPLAGYLGGEINPGGWWYYFPVAMLIKTPVGLLALAAAGLFFAIARRVHLGTLTLLFVVLPALAYLGVAMTSAINIGLRHVLPVYPFVLLLAGLGARELLLPPGRFKWALVAAPVVFWAVTFAQVYPYTLTFFNRLVGGPSRGIHYLADSNLDWGQHLKLVKAWMTERGVEHLNLAYFGMADPRYYGIAFSYLPGSPLGSPQEPPPKLPGYVGIGATILSGVYLRPEWRTYYRGFLNTPPVAVLGNSIYLYRVETWPGIDTFAGDQPTPAEIHQLAAVADALFLRKKWYEHAALYYAEYLKHRPDNPQAILRYGLALLQTKRAAEALPWLARAAAQSPRDARLHRQIASQLLNQGEAAAAIPYAQESVRLSPASLRSKILLEIALNAAADPTRTVPLPTEEIEDEAAAATEESAGVPRGGRP